MPPAVEAGDRTRFTELVLREFDLLYEGNIARFGLRLSEYQAWRQTTQP